MQPIQFFAARAEDGALLPGATVDVFVHGTQERAVLYSSSPVTTPIENPVQADANARVFFYTTAARIDLRISRYGYVAPLLVDISTWDAATAVEQVQAQIDSALNKISDSLDEMEQEFNALYNSLGFEPVYLIYGAGIKVERPKQLVQRDGELYQVVDQASLPLILSGSWATDASKLKAVGDRALRTEMASADGASFVRNLDQTLDIKLKEQVSIRDYGGGEEVSDNLPAYNRAKAAVVPGGKIKFPKLSTGVYYWPVAGADLSGIVLDPDPEVTFSGAIYGGMFSSNIVTTTDYVYRVTEGNPKNYDLELRANFSRGSRRNKKRLWLSESDITDRRPKAVVANGAATELVYKQIGLGGDTVVSFSPAGGGADTLYLTPPSGGQTQLGLYALRPGSSVVAGVSVPPSNQGEIAVGVIFSTGYCVLRGYPNSDVWELVTKYQGVAQTVLRPAVISDTPGYRPDCPILTVRFITSIRFQVLISGSVLVDVQLTSGYLMYAGFGATGIGSGASINYVGWYSEKFKVSDSPRSRVLGFLGDSLTDDLYGAHPWWIANALDGSFGIRINGIENRAISGQTTQQQLNNLNSNPFVNASDVLVFVGTNDTQGANTYAAFVATYSAVLEKVRSEGRSITLAIFPLWWTQAQSGGSGGASQNASKGGDMRAAIGRFAADRGYNLIDLTHVTGPLAASYLNSTFADSYLRDNVHQTSYLNEVFGYAIAKCLAETICPVSVPNTSWMDIAASSYAAGFSGSIQFRFIDDDIEFRGSVTANSGNIADGTTVFNTPEFLVPNVIRMGSIFGSVSSSAGFVAIKSAAVVRGVSASPSASFDGVRYSKA
ncbi:SGNH/GDSL hydrolase family protein [Pseudomonas fluorescens]|uniref:SGNH/GDSL hydrolase family protein n=1 Tax=Pseudomonas fluorescens TaxID=294 RepID=UPI001BEBB8B2|nr:SGNH/GDSL hydrolase family protein [Pseudomonas fluorescens]MBT2371925.1 SGNH/GDSL hydrolase family protein [Pseudomonas fluorescens]